MRRATDQEQMEALREELYAFKKEIEDLELELRLLRQAAEEEDLSQEQD